MSDTTVHSEPLPFGERTTLRFSTDGGAVVVRPVAADEQPRIEIAGPNAGMIEVDIDLDDDAVRADVELLARGADAGRTTITLFVPAALRGSIRSDIGSIDAEGLAPCDVKLATDTGLIAARDLQGRLRVRSDVGDVEVSNAAPCDIDVKSETGSIRLAHTDGRLKARTETGAIAGHDIAGTINARTEFGTIMLDVHRLDPGEHDVSTESGAVEVKLARGLAVHLKARAEYGTVQVRYPSQPDAPAVLKLSTDIGTVSVLERGATVDAMQDLPSMAAQLHASGPPFPPAPPAPPAPPTPPTLPFVHQQAEGEGTHGARDEDALERILRMVESGRLSARDANELLTALERR